MKILRFGLIAAAIVGAAACERSKAPPPADSAGVRPSGVVVDTVASTAASRWDASAGSLLLVAADSANRALLVVPDSATATAEIGGIPHPASVTLFSRSGSVQLAEMPTVGSDSAGCPVGMLSAAPPPHPWNVGFLGGVVAPLPIDSSASLAADSASLVVWMNRLASALPNDPAGRFSGLPFVVTALWRFTVPGGQQVAAATLMRQLNQEATPLEEHTFLIAERPANDTTYTTAYSERSYGQEETIESREVLAGALLGAARNPALIIARDFGDAVAYGLLERDASGKWSSRWTSARRHC